MFKTRGKTNPPKPGSIRIRRGSVRIFEDSWIRGSKKKNNRQLWHASRSAGEPCTCSEKFWPRPIFKIFSLDQIRVDQEKKEVRKRRASIYRTSPSDAVEHFLVSHVITNIVVIKFVISKNRRLGAISTTLNRQRSLACNCSLVVKPFFNFQVQGT